VLLWLATGISVLGLPCPYSLDTGTAVGNGQSLSASSQLIAQTVQLAVTTSVSAVSIWGNQIASGSPSTTLALRIYPFAGTLFNWTVAPLAEAQLSNTEGDLLLSFVYSSPPTLSAGNYALVLGVANAGTSLGSFKFFFTGSDYVGGMGFTSSNQGTTWSTAAADFAVHIDGADTTINCAGSVASPKLRLQDDNGMIQFGAASDVSLYRAAAGPILQTDESLIVGGPTVTLSATDASLLHTGSGHLKLHSASGNGVTVDGVTMSNGAVAANGTITLASTAGQLIAHTGSGTLAIQSATAVSVQSVTFTSGDVSLGAGNSVSVGGTTVLRTQDSAVADALTATTPVDCSCNVSVVAAADFDNLVVSFNTLLARLRAHGLIAP